MGKGKEFTCQSCKDWMRCCTELYYNHLVFWFLVSSYSIYQMMITIGLSLFAFLQRSPCSLIPVSPVRCRVLYQWWGGPGLLWPAALGCKVLEVYLVWWLWPSKHLPGLQGTPLSALQMLICFLVLFCLIWRAKVAKWRGIHVSSVFPSIPVLCKCSSYIW